MFKRIDTGMGIKQV